MANDDHSAGSDTANQRLQNALAAEVGRQLGQDIGGGLFLVATPIGNLGDITVRALAILARVDLVCCEDTRHSRTLLAHYGISRPLRALHEHNEEAEVPRLLAQLEAGRSIALISDAGTPLVSDPGYKLARAAIAAGHRVTALPGPCAALAGLAVSGLPSDRFEFAGFLPPRRAARRTRLGELKDVPATLVLYEAPGRVAETVADIARTMGDRDIAIARELTKRFEEVRRGPAGVLAAALAGETLKGEIVIIIAAAAAEAVDDEAIRTRLRLALEGASLRDAAREVAQALGVPRSRVYDLGLAIKDEA